MADLSLRIKADFNEASRQFKALAENSEDARLKIERFTKKIADDHASKFIDRQNLMGAAITATKGNLAALEAQKASYGREIERLIKSGLDPESDTVKKLQKEYEGLTDKIKVNEAAHRMQEAAVKAAKGALLGIGAAVVAAGGLALKAAADVEDKIASLTPMMGGSVEAATKLFKTIQKEAATTPFEIDSITDSVRTMMPAFKGSADEAVKAFRMLGDTAQGNSQKLQSITSAYTKAIMKNKVSMMELNTINNAGVPIFNEMAESMGITVEKLMDMSSKGELTGEHLTGAFKKMTSEGGLFFNGMESASDTFNMRVLGLKENLGILAGEIGQKLLPAAKDIAGAAGDAVGNFLTWIQEGNNLDRALKIVGYTLAGLTAGLTAFLVVTKGAAALQTLAMAFRGLNAAIAANPIGAIAVAITTVLVPALIYLYNNWDYVQTYLEQGMARVQYAFKLASQAIQGNSEIMFDVLKIAASKYFVFWFDGITFVIRKTLELLSKLPGELSKPFEAALNAIDGIRIKISGLSDTVRENSSYETQAIMAGLDAELAVIDEKARARRAELNEKKQQAKEAVNIAVQATQAVAEIEKQSLRERVESFKKAIGQIDITEKQALAERAASVEQFLTARAEKETKDIERRKEYMRYYAAELLENEKLTADEREAINTALQAAIEKIQIEAANRERDILQSRLSAMGGFFGGFSQLLAVAGKENRAAAIAAKVLASAEAGIQTALAIMKTFGQYGFTPWGIAAVAGVTAAGVAQQIQIARAPIPAAETGGRFIVPDLSPRVDSVGLRVNPGETVDVTPRGESGGINLHQIIKFENQTLFEIINRGLRSGDIYETSPAWNI